MFNVIRLGVIFLKSKDMMTKIIQDGGYIFQEVISGELAGVSQLLAIFTLPLVGGYVTIQKLHIVFTHFSMYVLYMDKIKITDF